MKIVTIVNGTNSIVLQAETEIESIILKELSKSEVSFQVHEKLQIIDKVMPNSAIITPKVMSNKTEEEV